jgi:LPS sulfotransferase NodH
MGKVSEWARYSALALKAAVYKLFATGGHMRYKKFIVLSRPRTGSNMLISFLNSHPNIHAKSEIFANLNGRACKDILARGFARQPFYVKAAGFKIFYHHPFDDDSGDVWDILTGVDDLRIIHLKRRNTLRALISRKIAVAQGVWTVSLSDPPKDNENKAVTFTVQELEAGFRETKRWVQFGDEKFKAYPMLTVYYEDLVNDPETVFRKITDFLGVRFVSPRTDLKKLNPEKMRDLVTNYAELKSAFQGTEWQAFFEE